MFEDLVKDLASNGITVTVQGEYDIDRCMVMYTANVSTSRGDSDQSWPTATFTAKARKLDEIAEDILHRLPLISPLVDTFSFRASTPIGDLMRDIMNGKESINSARARLRR